MAEIQYFTAHTGYARK